MRGGDDDCVHVQRAGGRLRIAGWMKRDYREILQKQLKEKYLKIGTDKCYHHGKHIEPRLLLVKEHGISEKTPCGIPQQQHFIEMEHAFDLDEEGSSASQTVVIQGCAGIGKTAVVHKFMFNWAAGMVTPGRFDYLMYVNCREINHITNVSAVDLIGYTFQDIERPILDVILTYPEKLLFIFDGFPELQDSVGDQEGALTADPQEKKTVEALLCSFVKKKLFPESSLLITARPTAMKKLHSLLKQPIQVEILWFTEAEKRSYFLSQYSGASMAMKVFYGLRDNESLEIMSSLPIISWIICTVLQSQGEDDKALMRSLQTMTNVYLFYFSKCLKTLTGISVWNGQSCLWGLCSLAAEGLQKQKVLFQVNDLRRHGIRLHDINCIFLSHFLQKAERGINVYTFLHFSFQEFLTAVFYALKNESSWMFFNQVEKTWQEIFQQYGKGFSSLTIQFLFGLLHKGNEKTLETTFGRKVSPGLREELLKWTEKEIKDKSTRLQLEPVDLFHCLYEIQEEKFAEKIIGDLQSIILLQPTYTKMDILAMSYCVKSSQRHLSISLKCQHLLGFEEGGRASAFRPPAVMRNQSSQMRNLPLSQLHFLCKALRSPNCKIKHLKLYRCLISSASCGALAAVLSTSQCLTELEFSETKLEASALKFLCEGLKDPNCKLQKLKLCASFHPEHSEVICKYLASVLIYKSKLIELDLSENPLGDTGVKYLCEGLSHFNCRVEKLDLSTCNLTDASCVDLSSFLRVSQSLKELFVFANPLGDKGIQLLCEGLQRRRSTGIIENLVLWTCHLTGACCQYLCSALSINETLRDLDLSDNALGDDGMQVLCEGLKHPGCKLQTLWLAKCHLTDTCCEALASVLSRNENLTLLDITGNDFRDFGNWNT
ncbi:PREDICTED: NACHT, LRR and PYD domains-containing protein 12-like [Elephantulus edwardii]|uniref:NACHT, LRR and PYD domains-containing protein 12-like n=1 Tax=Elephantulus edwardii TaxID=28737 RepID=UPI0003F0792D|nr:PREDICTED: NACHT, LRR and PYD domains-containing protein 12-like [Elephantulus edwardii]